MTSASARTTRALLMLTATASVIACLWAGHWYWVARSDASLALRQLDRVSTDTREIALLRSSGPPESRRSRPPPGLATRVADVVSKAGLPQPTLQNLSPETESAAGASGLRRQVAKMTLEPLTLPDLGRFLEEWRKAEPTWTVSSIDITPAPTRNRTAGQGDRPLRAVIGIETVFADKEASH